MAEGEHVLAFDARQAGELLDFLAGEGSCALGLTGVDRLFDALLERPRADYRWRFSEAERVELLDEIDVQDCPEMTEERVFAYLHAGLRALGA